MSMFRCATTSLCAASAMTPSGGRRVDPRWLVAVGWVTVAALLSWQASSWITPLCAVTGFFGPFVIWKWLDLYRSRRRKPGHSYYAAAVIPSRDVAALGITPVKAGLLTRVLRGYALSGNLTITAEQLHFGPSPIWRWAGYTAFTI